MVEGGASIMPTITVSKSDIESLIGKRLPSEVDKLNDIFQYVGGEVESVNEDSIEVEIKCRNRPDLWCAEGIARELRGALGIDAGLVKYSSKPSGVTLKVDPSVKTIRPLIAAAVVKDIHITEELLLQMIQLQEKVCMTYGRKRKSAAMGIYDFDKVIGDVTYKAADPKTKFIPLEFENEMELRDILEVHPKGNEYAHLLKYFKKYPLVVDSENNVLSMPPVINSNYSGKVSEDTRNLFIEVTGDDWETVHTSLLIAVCSLADRGARIESVKVKYSDKTIVTPNFSPKKWKINVSEINNRLGLNLTPKNVCSILAKGRYSAEASKEELSLEIPCYRADILHNVDIIEDVAIMYGYSNFTPQSIDISTSGKLSELTKFSNKIRELMVGFGVQEVQTFTLTSKEILADKINLESEMVKIENPMSSSYEYLRNSIWPMLIDFLGKNTNREYPQKIFEVGEVVIPNSKAETKSDTVKKLAYASASAETNFTEAKQVAFTLLSSLGKEMKVRELEHTTFIPGRAGEIIVNEEVVGIIGEVSPEVLSNFGIELPLAIFEIHLSKLF